MRVRWTTLAADDVARIVEYIQADNPVAARRVGLGIYEAVLRLATFPNRGRLGLVENTRELILVPWPYVIVYEVLAAEVQVLRIRHASQDWP